jgi:GT2 family glycosyltransferase
MTIAALIPTLNRPDGLRRVLQSLRDTAPSVVPVVAADMDDTTAQAIATEHGAVLAVIPETRRGCAYAWNAALRAAPAYDVYVIASDDCEFTPGWLEASLAALAKLGGSGLVGFNDGKKRAESLAVLYLMTRDFITEHHGGVAAVPHYFTWGVDTEAIMRAQAVDKYVKALDAKVLHHWGGPKADSTYAMGAEHRDETKRIYGERRDSGFPDDFERII